MFRRLLLAIAAALTLAVPASAQQARAPLDLFYGYDQLRGAELSPSGRYIAVIRRDATGDVLLIVDMETRQSRAIQSARAEHQMEINFIEFKTDDRLVFGVSQKVRVVPGSGSIRRRRMDDGFEWVSRVYSSNVDGSGLIALYDPSGGQGFPRHLSAGIISMLPRDDNHVLLIVPNYGGAELRRVNIVTGAHSMVERGYANTAGWVVDINGAPVMRMDAIGGGRGYAWMRRGPGQREWSEIIRYRGAEGANSGPTFRAVGPAVNPGQVFVLARREGQDTSGLYVYDTATGAYVETIAENADFDISGAAHDTRNNVILAACWWGYMWECLAKDEGFGRQWTAVTQALGDQVNVRILGRGGEGGQRWLVQSDGPQDLGTFYIYDGATHSLNRVFTSRPAVDPALLPTQRVVHYTASDGMRLWGYLWVPPGVTNVRNLPTIVVPHGGPEGRDVWGFDPFAMAFASQGYAVFQPNFRGGGGFGRRFVEAGHGQWGQRMQEDVADGARFLIAQGITDPNRICITGWSYGGYVSFTAAFLNTDIFRCSVAGAGVSDLNAMQRWVRSGDDNDVISGGGSGSTGISYRYWRQAIGDNSAMLDRYSAAQNADRVTIPLLIIHGDEDQTVPIAQSEIMVRAMERAGRPTRLIRLEDIDHYFSPDQGEAWRTVFTESLAFYREHIGPGVEPGSQ